MLEVLRNFGERHQDLAPLLQLLGSLLRLIALDVDHRHSSGWFHKIIQPKVGDGIETDVGILALCIPLIFYVNVVIGVTSYVYAYLISATYYIFWRDADLLVKIIFFSISISSLLGLIKLMFMYIYRHKLKNIVSAYLQCDAAVSRSRRARSTVRAALRGVRRRAAFFWLIVCSNGLIYVLRPLVTPGRQLLEDQQIFFGLEPAFESPNYEIGLAVESFAVYFIIYVTATITAFHIIIVGYSEALMLALSQELLHLWEDAQRNYQIDSRKGLCSSSDSYQEHSQYLFQNEEMPPISVEETFDYPIQTPNDKTDTITKTKFINDFIRRGLLSVIKRHAVNIELIRQIEGIFEKAIAMEFIMLSIGLIAELLGGLENTYMQIPFALIQVSMDCVTGQKLIDSSQVFETAVYDCKWENFDVKNKKLVLVLLQKAQKTLQLSAGGLVRLSNLTVMSVIKSIYQAYTALHSTMD